MLIRPEDLKALIDLSTKIFVLVKLNSEDSIYLGINKTVIKEYLNLPSLNLMINVEFNEDKELLIGFKENLEG